MPDNIQFKAGHVQKRDYPDDHWGDTYKGRKAEKGKKLIFAENG